MKKKLWHYVENFLCYGCFTEPTWSQHPSFSASAIFHYCLHTSIRRHLHRRLPKVSMQIHPFVHDRLHYALLQSVHYPYFVKGRFNHRDWLIYRRLCTLGCRKSTIFLSTIFMNGFVFLFDAPYQKYSCKLVHLCMIGCIMHFFKLCTIDVF